MATSKWTQADIDAYNQRQKQFTPVMVVEPAKEAKKAKYGNKKVKVGDEELDSIKEANRYKELMLQEQAGLISNLRRQVKYTLHCNGEAICSYDADFVYERNGKRIVEDVKSEMTRKLPVYRIKKKMMLACHGIEIQEV